MRFVALEENFNFDGEKFSRVRAEFMEGGTDSGIAVERTISTAETAQQGVVDGPGADPFYL